MNAVWPQPVLAPALQNNILSLVHSVQQLHNTLQFRLQAKSGHTAWFGKQQLTVAKKPINETPITAPIITLNTQNTFLPQLLQNKPELKNRPASRGVSALQNSSTLNKHIPLQAYTVAISTAQPKQNMLPAQIPTIETRQELANKVNYVNTNASGFSAIYKNYLLHQAIKQVKDEAKITASHTNNNPVINSLHSNTSYGISNSQSPTYRLLSKENTQVPQGSTANATTGKKIDVHIARFAESINLHVQQLPKAMEMTEDKIKQMFIRAISSAQSDLY
jgi:hypothetical protein